VERLRKPRTPTVRIGGAPAFFQPKIIKTNLKHIRYAKISFAFFCNIISLTVYLLLYAPPASALNSP
jgi:hypothetical protein